MTVRRILTWPDPALQNVAEDVSEFGDVFAGLVADMEDTLKVNHGLGLAAPQIGQAHRVVMIRTSALGIENPNPRDPEDDYWVLVNPTLTLGSEKVRWKEACLSVPYAEGHVERSSSVHVEYQNQFGESGSYEAEWPVAGVLQHECDHLDGILYIDRMSRMSKSTLQKKIIKRIRKEKKAREAYELQMKRDLEGAVGQSNSSSSVGKKKDPKKKKRAQISKKSRMANRKKK